MESGHSICSSDSRDLSSDDSLTVLEESPSHGSESTSDAVVKVVSNEIYLSSSVGLH